MGQQKIESGQDVTHLMNLKSGDDVTDLMNAQEEPPNRTDLILSNPLKNPNIEPVKSNIKPNSTFQNLMDHPGQWLTKSLTGWEEPTPEDYQKNGKEAMWRAGVIGMTSPLVLMGESLGAGGALLNRLGKFGPGAFGKGVEKFGPEIEKEIIPKIKGLLPEGRGSRFTAGPGGVQETHLLNPQEESRLLGYEFKRDKMGNLVPAPLNKIPKKPEMYTGTGQIVPDEGKIIGKGIKLEDAQAGLNNVPPNNVPPNQPPEIPSLPPSEFRQAQNEEGLAMQAAALMKGSRTTADLGPMFRQGIFYTGQKSWRKALVQQFKSFFGTPAIEEGKLKFLNGEEVHKTFRSKLAEDPLMIKGPDGKSLIDKMEIYIPELGTLTKEEAQAGLDITERVWGKVGVGKLNLGRIPRASSRAFADAIASLRVNQARVVMDNYGKIYKSMLAEAAQNPGKAAEILKDAEFYNPKNEEVLKGIGDEINTASGRGSLKIKGKSVFGKKIYGDVNLGKYADAANITMFSPRLQSSRIRSIGRLANSLNPFAYAKQDKVLRKEHWKQLLSLAGAITASNVAYSALGAKVGTDPTSSDFGKSRFGNITVDPTGGVGKFGTLAGRLAAGKITSAQPGHREFELGNNPVVGDATTLFGNLAKSTLSPAAILALEIVSTGGRSFTGKDMIGKPARFNSPNPFENPMVRDTIVPMIYQDIYEIIEEDPSYLGLVIPDALGQGINVFNPKKKKK